MNTTPSELTNELCAAVRSGDTDAALRAIGAGAAPNQSSNVGWTPLRYAAEKGDAAMVSLLLQNGADIRRGARVENDSTYLHHAATSGDVETVRVLLVTGSNPHARNREESEPLHCAAWSQSGDSVAVATLLLEAGASPCAANNYGATALHSAAGSQNAALVRLLLAHRADPNAADLNGMTPLHYAVRVHDISSYRPGFDMNEITDTVAQLLAAGANPNAVARATSPEKSASPLIIAAGHAPVSVVQRLINAGADVSYRDKAGRTPLGESLASPENVAALLAAGADIQTLAEAKGKPALLTATEHGNDAAIVALIAAGSDPNKAYRGKLPLHVAVAKAHPAAVSALLTAGANHLLPDKTGVTALDLARKRRRKAIVPLLEAAEAARISAGVS